MKRILPIAVVTLLVIAVAIASMPTDENDSSVGAVFGLLATESSDESLDQRITELERALNEERAARQLLEDELIVLMQEVYQTDFAAPETIVPDAEAVSTDASSQQRRESRRERNSRDKRAERLVAAGFDPARADWVLRRESELQMESLQARYEAGVNGNSEEYYRRRSEIYETLRAEIGDDDYERFLAANGSRTDIRISNVIDSSPAQSAGLRPGDRILRYDGARVFSMSDLTRQTLDGTPGENVVLNIERDGVPMQVVIPRGPLGVSGGR